MIYNIRRYHKIRKPDPELSFAENLQHIYRKKLNPVSCFISLNTLHFPTHLQLYSCSLSLQMQKGLLWKPLERFQYCPHPACSSVPWMFLLLTCLHRLHRDYVLNNLLPIPETVILHFFVQYWKLYLTLKHIKFLFCFHFIYILRSFGHCQFLVKILR